MRRNQIYCSMEPRSKVLISRPFPNRRMSANPAVVRHKSIRLNPKRLIASGWERGGLHPRELLGTVHGHRHALPQPLWKCGRGGVMRGGYKYHLRGGLPIPQLQSSTHDPLLRRRAPGDHPGRHPPHRGRSSE